MSRAKREKWTPAEVRAALLKVRASQRYRTDTHALPLRPTPAEAIEEREAREVDLGAGEIYGDLARGGLIEGVPYRLTEAGFAQLRPCKPCETRQRAGFDGLCPACANERARNERSREETPS